MGDINDTALMARPEEMSIEQVQVQVNKIQTLMKSVMHEGEHYGKIPGTDKTCLMKSGAEKLNFVFRLAPEFEIKQTDLPNFHREYQVKCVIKVIGTGVVVAEGVGSCSTMESKYRWRKNYLETQVGAVPAAYWNVPKDDPDRMKKQNAILADIFGPGKYKTKKSDEGWKVLRLEGEEGRKENEDIADTYNTVLKMAKKRAHVDATITACAASDIFTQDLDETLPGDRETAPEPHSAGSHAAPAQASARRAAAGPAAAGPMTFQRFIEIINEVVPSADRPGWMKKAQGGKDPALLARLAGEIRAAYGGESAAPEEPGSEDRTDADRARYQIVEYITHLVPAGERQKWLTRLEPIEHKLEPLASFYIELQTQYGDPGLFEE